MQALTYKMKKNFKTIKPCGHETSYSLQFHPILYLGSYLPLPYIQHTLLSIDRGDLRTSIM